MPKKLTTDEFIKKAVKIHINTFDYSKVIYNGNKAKVEIICPKHGSFYSYAENHLRGFGCRKCSDERTHNIQRKSSQQFVDEVKSIWGDKWVLDRTVYKGVKHKVLIGCKVHGYWNSAPTGLLQGHGCPKCGRESQAKHNVKTQKQFIEEANKVFRDKIDFSKAVYGRNNKDKVLVVCKKCKHEWTASPNNILTGHSCPKCNESKGEKAINKYLTNNLFIFAQQYIIKDCKNIKPLPFDFAVFNEDGSLKCFIEYQGQQHFKPIKIFGGSNRFKDLQKRDKIKKEYCKKNSIKFIEISYKEDIENRLKQELEQELKQEKCIEEKMEILKCQIQN